MKKNVFLILSVFICTLKLYSQEKINNYSFFKLCISNEKDEILLEKWNDSWEIPGKRYVGSNSISEFIKEFGNKFEVNISEFKLNGLFTFHHNTRSNPTIMYYFTTNVEVEKNINQKNSYKWFSLEEAFETIPYSEMIAILKQIYGNKNNLFGASFYINTVNNKRESKIIENFYILN